MRYLGASIVIFFSTALSAALSPANSVWFNMGYLLSGLMLFVWGLKNKSYIKRVYDSGELTTIYRYGAVILILFLTHLIITRHNSKLDLTATRKNSLAPKTVNILTGLDENARLWLFMKKEFVTEGMKSLLELLSARGNHFEYTFVDPDIQPVKASEMGVTRYNTLILEYRSRRKCSQGFLKPILLQPLSDLAAERRPLFFLQRALERKALNQRMNREYRILPQPWKMKV